jgi:glyoxylase-like metal-dependent hydrolase (beta-lactamase superfamily II)
MWTIDALPVGSISGVPKDILVLYDRSGEIVDIPLTMFVLRNGDTTVVVDTGGPVDEARVRAVHGWSTYTCPPSENPTARGIDPDEVTIVVNTHLHWDHCSNNGAFPRAEVVVQDAELRYAVHPCRAHCATYEVLPDVRPHWLADLHRMRTVSGRGTLAEGLEVIPLPGHSPGSQGVVVETAKGPFVITGDCVNLMDNWGTGGPGTERAGGRYSDLPAFYDSLDLLKRSGWTPLPSHDRSVVDIGHFG